MRFTTSLLAVLAAGGLVACGGDPIGPDDGGTSDLAALEGLPVECPASSEAVCGADGITYPNACEARRHGVPVLHEGPCEDGEVRPGPICRIGELCDIVCPDVWDPVCGVDGRTYGNACEAHRAGVRIAHRGECGESGGCTTEWDPVCGSDGVTYPNPCEARRAGVRIVYRGECRDGIDPRPGPICPIEDPRCEIACPDIYDPVCGSDGVTYPNACEARRAGVRYTHGPCAVGIDPPQPEPLAAAQPDLICPDVWDPVCGVDGRTYSNDCYAARAGVEVAYEGICGRVGIPREPIVIIGPPERRPPPICPQVIDPVCGIDGRTYQNACYALYYAGGVAHRGPCEGNDR